MRFTEYKGSLTVYRRRNMMKIEGEFKEFLKMNVKIVKVTFTKNEYSSAKSCYNSLYKAAKRLAIPISVKFRDGVVYLINNEIE